MEQFREKCYKKDKGTVLVEFEIKVLPKELVCGFVKYSERE